MMKVDLNSDIGESFGAYTLGMDTEILKIVTSANIACGFHAGDPLIMQKTVKEALNNNVLVGAHISFPDLVGFGRRNMAASPQEVFAMTIYQIGALDAFVRAQGAKLHHVKPHGALYNMASSDEKLAEAICRAVYAFDSGLVLYALSGGKMITEAQKIGLKTASEVFADRTYQKDGSLTPRRLPGSMITDEEESLKQVLQMVKEGTVKTLQGDIIPIKADTICVHGDEIKAVEFARTIKQHIEI